MDLKALQKYVAADFARFVAYKQRLLGYQICERHLEIADFLQGSGTRKAVMGPRLWSSKTTIARWYIDWRWLRNRATKVIVISNTDDNAKAMTGAVHNDLKLDPVLRHLAPVGGKVGEYVFNVRGHTPEKGKSIRCAGMTTALTSDRADLIVVDDTESDKLPETRYDLVIANLDEAEALLHEPGRLYFGIDVPEQEELQFLVVGQPHWEGSAYVTPIADEITGERAEHPLNNCEFLWLPAMVNPETGEPDDSESGVSNFPEVVSTERCFQKKGGMSSSKWALEYQLDTSARDADKAVIHMSRIEIVSRVPAVTIMVVDPADGGDAEWGIAIMGLIDSQIHIRHIMGLRESDFADLADDDIGIIDKLWERIFDVAEDNGVAQVWIEQNLVSAVRSCQRYINKHGLRVDVMTYVASTGKLKRICGAMELPVKTGMITAEPHVFMDRATTKQFRELRRHKLPNPVDRLDVTANGVILLMDEQDTAVVPPEQRVIREGAVAFDTAPANLHARIHTRPREDRMPDRTRRNLAARR